MAYRAIYRMAYKANLTRPSGPLQAWREWLNFISLQGHLQNGLYGQLSMGHRAIYRMASMANLVWDTGPHLAWYDRLTVIGLDGYLKNGLEGQLCMVHNAIHLWTYTTYIRMAFKAAEY